MNRVGAGVTLRHWSAGSVSSGGGSVRPSPALSGLAEGRRMNQVVSMLKRIRAPQAQQDQAPQAK